MHDNSWSDAFSELAATVVGAFVRFCRQDLVQVGLAIAMFLALALPLLLVIVLLWYLDSTGWRPQGGFYQIGLWSADPLGGAHSVVAGLGLWMGKA